MGVDLLMPSSASFADAMGEFLQKYDGHPSLKSCFNSGAIRETLTTLLQFLADRSNDVAQHASDIVKALRCIKSLTRARTELDILLEEPHCVCIIDLISSDLSADSNVRNPIANEAIRILINLCIIHQTEALAVLRRHKVYFQLLNLLNEVPAVSTSDDLIFAIARLLFYVCLDNDIQRQVRDDANALRLLADKVIQYVYNSDPGSISLRSNNISSTCIALSELLRVLFALGSNHRSPADCQQLWQSLISPLIQLLLGQNTDIRSLSHEELQALPKSTYYTLMLDIVHLFYCFDEDNLRCLLDKQVIQRITGILEAQGRYNCPSAESSLVPILIVLDHICKLNSEVAHDVKEFIFGQEFANNKSLKYEFEAGDTTLSASSNNMESNTPPPPLHKILRQLITTFNPNVKEAVSQFLFTICGSDANEYIRVVGFGNAIGLLTQLNLPGFQTH